MDKPDTWSICVFGIQLENAKSNNQVFSTCIKIWSFDKNDFKIQNTIPLKNIDDKKRKKRKWQSKS